MGSQPVTKDQIAMQAVNDPDFKAELLKDPKGALKKQYGIDIPEGINLQVFAETDTDWYLIIPQNPDRDILDTPTGGVW